ncbi:MAG: hypothetical protein A3F41_05090 [Coxiella sp. RIFCSPHIGHO2_12_FULL_44_14]|nr:MAG: hypothetical protein A3F41_05090 [Coxiella sp. RIFCSPHIGHO2_12_FULL_44_14]
MTPDQPILRKIFYGLLISLGLLTTAWAGQCPTTMQQDGQKYWVSNDPPGWKSHKPTAKDITLTSDRFGGVVYSPEKKRIACVYKGSDGQWIALLSDVYHPFNEDDLQGKTWEYSPEHKDYVCGQPEHALEECQFDVKKT